MHVLPLAEPLRDSGGQLQTGEEEDRGRHKQAVQHSQHNKIAVLQKRGGASKDREPQNLHFNQHQSYPDGKRSPA